MVDSKITLYTEEVIDSAHYLQQYVGKCAAVHGHSWLLQLWVQGYDSEKDIVGILFDFGNIKKIKEMLDHQIINECSIFEESRLNPTAENITLLLLGWLNSLYPNLDFRIRLYETAVLKKTFCQRQTSNFEEKYI